MSFILKFLFFLGCCLVISAVLWEYFMVGNIYYCVWGIPYIDFFFPDRWYHGSEGGDMLKAGWSVDKLKAIWYFTIAFSVLTSGAFAWSGKKR